MTAIRALLLTTAALACAVSACRRPAEEAPAAPAAANARVTPAEAGAPMSFADESQYAKVRLTLPEAIKPYPDLHARLYAEEVRKLRQFSEGAQADKTEAGSDIGPQGPYEKTVDVTLAGQTGKLLSLRRVDFDYSGGAHPNTLASGVLWDKALKTMVGPTDLFRKGADLSVLDQALCTAVNAAKRARSPGSEAVTLNGKMWACPRAASTPFILAPGDQQGKAAGLTFLIGPYQVGPYVEGAYDIAIPASVFRSLLDPAYASEFGGTLVKSGDVTRLNAA